jgi:PKD repeat protein
MGISYATQNIVYAVGTGGNVFKSTDGGHNWIINNTLPAMLFGVHFVNASFGVVGAEETIFATNDGGANWTTFTTGYENFYATRAYADGTAFVGGTDENIYTTSNFGQSWSMDYNGTGTSTLYRIRQTSSGTMWACGSQGRIMKKEEVIEADFTADPTVVCAGGSVNFYDNSSGTIDTWSWTFEGGNPATSSLENPVVTYSTTGTFDVSLTVTSGSNSNTETKTDYITVFQGTGQPVTPSGAAESCGTYSYAYATESVQYANSYEWQVDPVSAGSISGTGIVGTFLASNSWSGAYTVKVRAISQCGAGPWSTGLACNLFHNPVIYDLVGTGSYCEGEPGSEILLNGSETGITYELFKDNVTTGISMAGTGAQISFGFFDETGLYTATGENDHCSENMVGQIYVHMVSLPGQAAEPQGDQTVCNNMSHEYFTAGAANADEYAWSLEPADAGIVTSFDNECNVTWSSDFIGTALLTATGVNDCGSGIPSDALQILVNPAPAPAISGLSLVCDNESEDYSTDDNAGSSYEWTVTGGTIISGAGTHLVTILWGNPGTGSVSVTETNADGCNETAAVPVITIDDCTGVDEGRENNIRVYPNPATDRVTLQGLNNAMVTLYDIPGKDLMAYSKVTGSLEMDLSTFQKGIYLLKIEQIGTVNTIRLVKR